MFNTRNTKEQILALLKKNGSMTILELANKIEITEMAVRRHIQVLERDKMIGSQVKKQTMGRPSKVYQLAEQGENLFPKRYKEFSLDLLQGLKESGHEDLIKDILQKRKEKLLQRYHTEHKNEQLSGKLERLIRIQEMEGYMPQVENEHGVVHLKELNCPYVEIAKEFPQICQAERDFIKDFLHADELTTVSSLMDGKNCCHYTLHEK